MTRNILLLLFLCGLQLNLSASFQLIYSEGTCSEPNVDLEDLGASVDYADYSGDETVTIEQEVGGSFTATISLTGASEFYREALSAGIYKITINDPDSGCVFIGYNSSGSQPFDHSGRSNNATDCNTTDGSVHFSGADNTGELFGDVNWTVYHMPSGSVVASGTYTNTAESEFIVDIYNLLPGLYYIEAASVQAAEKGYDKFYRSEFVSVTSGTTPCDSWELPIELGALTGNYNERSKNVDIHFSTFTQFNVENIELQRSFNNKDFETIYSFENIEDSSVENKYNYEDSRIDNAHVIYYRLRVNDWDGAFEYSESISVKVIAQRVTLTLFPNPAKDNLTIEASNEGHIKIFNMQGILVSTIETTKKRNNLDISTFPKGIYMVKFSTEQFDTITKTLIVE